MGATTAPAGLEGGLILGYPRIGRHRELKRALESYWAGRSDQAEFERAFARVRAERWQREVERGLEPHTSAVPGDASHYDQVLDAAVRFGALPSRFAPYLEDDGSVGLRAAFAAARGDGDVPPLEMTKWFDTNYHYLVPEIGPDTEFSDNWQDVVAQFREGLALGIVTRPVIVGPVTLLALSKADREHEGFDPLTRLDALLPRYAALLAALDEAGVKWVQLDESALVSDLLPADRGRLDAAFARAAVALGQLEQRPAVLVATSYGSISAEALTTFAASRLEAIALDLVVGEVPDASALAAPGLKDKVLVAGLVDGHNVWRTDLDRALQRARHLAAHFARVAVGTSTSLFHVPHTLEDEPELDADLRSWLAFADEKIAEVAALDAALNRGLDEELSVRFEEARRALQSRADHPGVHAAAVRDRTAQVTAADRARAPYAERAAVQREVLPLPVLPTTTIGSFPQTPDIRRARAAFSRGELDEAGYRTRIRGFIADTIADQERLGLDVLVHGEAERNDMVQYFAEHLEGFATTRNGWVQSYGSRCTRPSILWGDVHRDRPITVEWSSYAQSLTTKPVKGMLTGPVTILAWSFVRDDQPKAITADQVALALRDEVADLEEAGIRLVQVDEPALRELLPLEAARRDEYVQWSVGAFRLATGGARPRTQVHTHLCYSEFGQILDAIDGLDADVTSIEAARSNMEIAPEIAQAGFSRGIGPGVYDIHSPRVPSEAEIAEHLRTALRYIPAERLWVNPDCGLKTRRVEEVEPALIHLVAAARRLRVEVTAGAAVAH